MPALLAMPVYPCEPGKPVLLTAAVFMGAAGLFFAGAALAGVAEPAEASTVTPEPVLLEGNFEEVGLTVGATEGRGGVSEDFP